MKNYYGSLCTELYEILHKDAPQEELDFYLSYARAGERILAKVRAMLKKGGKFVFAAETMADRCADSEDYEETASVWTAAGETLVLKTRHTYDAASRTQFSPGIYELYRDGELLQRETMDFQTHLYKPGEMELMLREAGFTEVHVYASFDKKPVSLDQPEMLLYECTC